MIEFIARLIRHRRRPRTPTETERYYRALALELHRLEPAARLPHPHPHTASERAILRIRGLREIDFEIGEACPTGARFPGDVCRCFDAVLAEFERTRPR